MDLAVLILAGVIVGVYLAIVDRRRIAMARAQASADIALEKSIGAMRADRIRQLETENARLRDRVEEMQRDVVRLSDQIIAMTMHPSTEPRDQDGNRDLALIEKIGDLLVDVLHGRIADRHYPQPDEDDAEDGDPFSVMDEPEVAFDFGPGDDYPELGLGPDEPEEYEP